MLRAAGFRGRGLREVKRESRTPSGRVRNLHLVGLVPEQISAQDFRNLVGRWLGWQLIKSTEFTVRRTGGGFQFEGQGFGHGVGLCVLGSVGRAARGDSAKKILDAYFPGLKIRTFDSAPSHLPHLSHLSQLSHQSHLSHLSQLCTSHLSHLSHRPHQSHLRIAPPATDGGS